MNIKLRSIQPQPAVKDGIRGVVLQDPLRLARKGIFIPDRLSTLLSIMDGTRNIGTLRTGFELRTGIPLSDSTLDKIISELDNGLLLDNERYELAYQEAMKAYRQAPYRLPVMSGNSYPAEKGELEAMLKGYLDNVTSGELGNQDERLKGLICPHIDFKRGGSVYAGAWSKAREMLNETELVIILGTDHNDEQASITLTRQDFQTPLGMVTTAGNMVDELVDEVGDTVLKCELNHKIEHSVEAAVIWFKYLAGGSGCPILPIICGSYQELIKSKKKPTDMQHIEKTIEVLRNIGNRQKTMVVAAADLAHMGPAFGDPYPIDFTAKATISAKDRQLIDKACVNEPELFFDEIRLENNSRHICGLPPIYLALQLLRGYQGLKTGYEQCPASDDGTSIVSICGIVYPN